MEYAQFAGMPKIEMPPFYTGQSVELVTGGPDMTVLDFCDDCGNTDVGYFRFSETEGWVFEVLTLPEEVLMPVEVN